MLSLSPCDAEDCFVAVLGHDKIGQDLLSFQPGHLKKIIKQAETPSFGPVHTGADQTKLWVEHSLFPQNCNPFGFY